MDSYLFLFVLGFAGLIIMALMGVAGGHHEAHLGHGHGGHHAGDFHLHGTGHHGLNHAPSHTAPHTPASGHAHTTQHGHHHGHDIHVTTWRSFLLSWLSPRILFTLALGIGATGTLLQTAVTAEWLRAGISLLGGIGLEKLIVSPLWNQLARFASRPARTLESAVMEEAVALTGFDADGCGLVSIDLDGHEMKVLGRLSTPQASAVHSGDRLLVESVDAKRGQCVVSPLK